MVLGVFRVVLSTIVFWLRWQVRKPNHTVTGLHYCNMLLSIIWQGMKGRVITSFEKSVEWRKEEGRLLEEYIFRRCVL